MSVKLIAENGLWYFEILFEYL